MSNYCYVIIATSLDNKKLNLKVTKDTKIANELVKKYQNYSNLKDVKYEVLELCN